MSGQRMRTIGLNVRIAALTMAWLVMASPVGMVQVLAALTGITGALLPGVDPAWGFAAFLISSLGWLFFAVKKRHWGPVAQQAVFLVTSLIGLWNWWLGPLVLVR